MLHHFCALFLFLGGIVSTAQAQGLGQKEAAPVAPMTLYIGTYTHTPQEGICVARFNSQTGELSPAQTVAPTSNPSFLATSSDGQFLYAVNEWGALAGANQGGLSAFRIEPQTGELSPLNAISQGGTPCHLTLDSTGKWLLVAAYSAGTVSAWPILPDGSIGPRASLAQHTGSGPNQQRQTSPHAHHIVVAPNNRRLFVADLGTDQVMFYKFDAVSGQISPDTPPSIALTAGAGPRHLALSPTGQFLYVVSELNNTVTVFKDALNVPQPIQTISTLPAGFAGQSFTAEIVLSPDGRFLYASNRGHNSIACYQIGADGHLELQGFAPTGQNPRHFAFDPTGKWLLAANQTDHSITVFRVDAQSGLLAQNSQLENIPGEPVCLLFGKHN